LSGCRQRYDAERFFADLVGAHKKHVALIEPKLHEMEDEGLNICWHYG
jgi:hypothetical protein